jgi:hypothetical protein
MEVMERYNIYDWILVVYVHEIPYYIHQSDAIVRCILEGVSGGPPGLAAQGRARVAVFVIRETVRQVMEPLPAGEVPAGDVGGAWAGGVVDPGRLAPVNYYRLTVSEVQYDERGVPGLAEVSGEGVGVSGEGRYAGRDGWRHAFRATFPRVRARRRMLVSFSHGAAFGINVDMEGLMRGNLSILWSDDLAAELTNCLGGQPIDVLLLNNCYMQCFETGYALRDQVRFIVAAEGALGAIGYDYAGLMKRLLEQPGDDNESLVKGIIGDYTAATSRAEQAGQAVFANRAGEYENAMVLLERLTAILVERMDELIDVLVDIRENKLLYVSAPLNGYTSNYLCMIDVFAWVSMVFDRLGDLFGGTGLAGEFVALRRRMVVAGEVGEGLVEHDVGGMGMPIYGYAGLSIFYPRAGDLTWLRPIPRCVRLAGPWKRFLEAYYARSGSGNKKPGPVSPAIKNPGPVGRPGIKS